jgi:hypothetical protein
VGFSYSLMTKRFRNTVSWQEVRSNESYLGGGIRHNMDSNAWLLKRDRLPGLGSYYPILAVHNAFILHLEGAVSPDETTDSTGGKSVPPIAIKHVRIYIGGNTTST